MIANYVNEQHDTLDQFLREFTYGIRTAVNETTGKTPAELFLGRKLITPFQKLVMVSDGTEFAVGDIERLFEEARRNTETKQEKWKKYYNRRRRDLCKLRLAINVDQVRIYRHRKCDDTEIGTGSTDNGSLHVESSGFDRVQRRSNDSRDDNELEKEKSPDRLKTQQGGPVRSRKGTERNDNPYIEERTRSSNKNARRGGDQPRQDQERRGTCTRKSLSLEVLVGNANYKS
ncbi:uncharacterized protein TNCV_2287111 [Trichonephila clavipes]|nr:uncharacterized protein TNCV_2287111 [Trichonephila clavipes]